MHGPKGGVNLGRGVRDALQAAEHLHKMAFVDPQRIAHVGFSWGAMVGLLANSRSFRQFQTNSPGFSALVSFYPGCFTVQRPDGTPLEIVRKDMDSRHLILMGAKDMETPADECVSKLGAAKAVGAPIEWEVYANATHCWDCENLNGLSKVDRRGRHVSYRYDAALTRESEHRMFKFLEVALGTSRK
jgi:dienelactone hydrolase